MKPFLFLCAAAFSLFAAESDLILRQSAVIDSVLQEKEPSYYNAMVEMRAEAEVIKQALNEDVDVVLYLTSSTVSPENLMKIAEETAQMGKRVYPVVRGLGKNMGGMGARMRQALLTLTPSHQRIVLNTIAKISVSPDLFNDLNVTKVPVIVTATCKGARPYARYCKLKTAASGETSLMAMAQQRFGPYAKTLDLFKEKP